MKIEVKNITKKYHKTVALNKVSFTLLEPKIYGLLGRNGAGKTTFMEILAGHQLPTSGEILVNGKQPFDHRDITENICLIKEGENFYKDLKVKQVLRSYSLFYPNWDEALAKELVQKYHLNTNKRIKALSKGMASAVGVIVGLASKAPITIFDEPYIGLDAAARSMFYDILLEEYEKERRTIILSTHLIDEVSQLFEEVIILREGKLLLHEKAETLREQAYAVTGNVKDVEKFIQNKQVMKTKQLANLMTAYVFDAKEEALPTELTVEGIPIQELMIYLTDSEGSEQV